MNIIDRTIYRLVTIYLNRRYSKLLKKDYDRYRVHCDVCKKDMEIYKWKMAYWMECPVCERVTTQGYFMRGKNEEDNYEPKYVGHKRIR